MLLGGNSNEQDREGPAISHNPGVKVVGPRKEWNMGFGGEEIGLQIIHCEVGSFKWRLTTSVADLDTSAIIFRFASFPPRPVGTGFSPAEISSQGALMFL